MSAVRLLGDHRGLRPPDALNLGPRTISHAGQGALLRPDRLVHREQGSPALSLAYTGRAGTFDFKTATYPGMSNVDLSWRISDHYPLWVEFATTR